MSEIINITPAEQRLQAQVQALESQLADTVKYGVKLSIKVHSLTEQLELERGSVHALSEQLESVRADAARYQQLRRGQHWSVIDGIGDTLRADTLDAAIDSALKAGGAA